MAGPWEQYGAAPTSGPWSAYAQTPQEEKSALGRVGAQALDIAKSLGSGLASGAAATVALPDTLASAAKGGIDYLAENFLPEGAAEGYKKYVGSGAEQTRREALAKGPLPTLATPAQAAGALSEALPKPETVAGEYARTLGEFAPAALVPGSMAQRITQVAAPALTSETAGQITKGTAAEPYARLAGAVGGALAPGMLARVVTPNPVSPERMKMVEALAKEGVDVTAGQKTGSRKLRYMESELGGGAAEDFAERQAEQFTNAALKRAGGSGRATPETMRQIEGDLGAGFKDISARNTLRADQQMVDDINTTLREYMDVLPSEQKAIVGNLAKDIQDRVAANNGTIPGSMYQEIRSRMTKRVKNAAKDPELSGAFRGLRDALDSAMDRSINPADAGAWAELRRKYGNFKTLENAAAGAGENAALGLISPAQLRAASSAGRRGDYAKGRGDLSELARSGEAIMRPLPDSGTSSRISARNLGASILSALGAGAGSTVGPAGAIAGALAGATVPAVAGRAMLSGPGRAYLGNQLLADVSPRGRDALIAALLASANNPMLRPLPPN
jgi:hypothetical protein